jgi:hypothetical protein
VALISRILFAIVERDHNYRGDTEFATVLGAAQGGV